MTIMMMMMMMMIRILPCFELEELWYIVDAREETNGEDVVAARPGVGHLRHVTCDMCDMCVTCVSHV